MRNSVRLNLQKLRTYKKLCIFYSGVFLIIWMGYTTYLSTKPLNKIIRYGVYKMDSIKVVISTCGIDPAFLDMTLVLLKSTVILTRSDVHFIILTDYMGFPLHSAMRKWPSRIRSRFSYEIRPIEYPGIEKKDLEEWKYMFKACSTQRLFISKMFPNLDSVLYIDADTLFLDDIEILWGHFSKFDQNQIAGIAEEFLHPTEKIGWGYWDNWGQGGKPPIVGGTGVNAGVMLMNLTRMRAFGWQEKILPIYQDYREGLYADQGIINVIFHRNMDKLYTLSCRWNYWNEYCRYGKHCDSVEESGVGVLHHTGYNWYFDKDLHAAVYGPFLEYNFQDDMMNHLVIPIKKRLLTVKSESKCLENTVVFTRGLESAIQRLQVS